jgi:AraC-like DNA-binding protein
MTPLIRSACLTNYASLAKAAGLDPLAMLKEVGLDAPCLENPDLKIPGIALRRLLNKSAQRSGWSDFGLRLAESRSFSVLGPLALLVREQPTLRQAMDMLMRYMHLHCESLHVWLEEDNRTATIRLECLGRGAAVYQSMELSMGMLYRFLKQALPETWRAQRVCFMHAAPTDLRTATRIFSRRVEFGAPLNGIVCLPVDLQMPLSTYSRLDRYVQQYVESLGPGLSQASAEKVRRLALTLLPSGKCTLEHIARNLGVDERTVRRRLQREGLSFIELLNQVRRDLVSRYLSGPPRKHAEVAVLLGFSGPSSFSRWFRQQFGCSATEWSSPLRSPGNRPCAGTGNCQ